MSMKNVVLCFLFLRRGNILGESQIHLKKGLISSYILLTDPYVVDSTIRGQHR